MLVLTLGLTLLCAGKAYAGDDVWTMAQSEKYGTKAGGMLGRGLVNAATCFVDIIVQTVNGTQDGPPFVGTLTGLGGGIGCTALRATSGVLDVATFWVPGFNGIPVSRSYDNCMDMESEGQPAAFKEAQVPAEPLAAPVAPAPTHNPNDYVKK